MRTNTPGVFNADAECLPNYTLVSGLPTYDDALEQLRLGSTNHLLINHQTIMKIFGSIKDKPKKQKPDIPVPTYEDSIRSQLNHSTDDGSPAAGGCCSTSSCSSQSVLLSKSNNSANHRFKCTKVSEPVEPPHEQNASYQITNEQSSNSNNQSQVFISSSSNSLGSLNISKEIEKSRPEIKWSPHSHRSSSLCIGSENPFYERNHRRLEHRGSLT